MFLFTRTSCRLSGLVVKRAYVGSYLSIPRSYSQYPPPDPRTPLAHPPQTQTNAQAPRATHTPQQQQKSFTSTPTTPTQPFSSPPQQSTSPPPQQQQPQQTS